jgi:hypothetical protein
MRCDICTTTFARVPLLVSGAAQTCFDDQVKISITETLNKVPVYFDFGKIGNSIEPMSYCKGSVTLEGLVLAYM